MGETGWNKAKDDKNKLNDVNGAAAAYKPTYYDDEHVKAAIERGRDKTGVSPICAGVAGYDGTCKSGVALDIRPMQMGSDRQWEIRDDWKNLDVISIDMDASSAPLKDQFFSDDKHMIVMDPLVLLDEPRKRGGVQKVSDIIDHVSTYNKLIAIARYLYNNQHELEVGAIIGDGYSMFLKTCEHVMRYEDLRDIGPGVKINDQWQWQNRNDKYSIIFELSKRMKANFVLTAHYKDLEKYQAGKLSKVGEKIDWEKRTPGKLFQMINCSRIVVGDKIQFIAEVMKAKGAPHLEGYKHIVMEVEEKGGERVTTWHGFWMVWEAFRTGKTLNQVLKDAGA